VSWVARDIRSIEQSQHWCIRRSQNSLAFELLETVNIHFVSGAPVKVDNLNGHASRQYQAINQSHKPNMINLYAMWHDTAPTVLYNCSIQKGLIMFRTTLHPSACQELESSVRIFFNNNAGEMEFNLKVRYYRVGNIWIIKYGDKRGIIG
jgi:hypothetical protein